MASEQPLVHVTLDVEDVRCALSQAWCDRFGGYPSPRSVCLLLAHIAQETGMTECRNNNLGNVKATIGGDVDWCVFKTWELMNGVHKDIVGVFRSFPTLRDGAEFFLGFLATHEPDAWPAVMSGDPDAFAMGLKKDRYYTADEAEYAAGVRGRFQFYWVHLAQTLLVAAGYPLKVDGFGGRETSGAIARFQTATPGLQVTGAISVSTMAALQAAWPVPDAPDTLPEIEATLPNA